MQSNGRQPTDTSDGNGNNDERLLALVKAGDFRALEQLYNLYNQQAFAIAMRILNDAGAAEDAVQEVFLKVWRQPASYDAGRGKFITWLLSVVRNQCIDQLRRQRQTLVSLDDDSQEQVFQLADDSAGPEEEVWQRIKRDKVRKAMNDLPHEQRRMIELAFFGGYTHSEIADLTKEPLGTVKSRIRQGLLKLKSVLQSQELRPEL